jgi:hypothetical protein
MGIRRTEIFETMTALALNHNQGPITTFQLASLSWGAFARSYRYRPLCPTPGKFKHILPPYTHSIFIVSRHSGLATADYSIAIVVVRICFAAANGQSKTPHLFRHTGCFATQGWTFVLQSYLVFIHNLSLASPTSHQTR